MIKSHTSHYIYNLKGEVPSTMDTRQTGEIYELEEFEWYCWVMLRDKAVSFPESPWVLGRYYGSSGDAGPAMAAKLLNPNGQIVVPFTFRALTNT